ncbi:glycine decarboxylase, PLP-dependent, subunit (protein P) of glycine cleavage complex [Burkholderiales bacterium 8X]|nr:glycine decarboxylase, PLP-dependent, subunit (protein P) of glycine cleavage complex [Burkholderiales bacterium 8X]
MPTPAADSDPTARSALPSMTHSTSTASMAELENHGEFIARHIGIEPDDEARMLQAIGSDSRAELIDGIVPASIRRSRPMRLPPPASEAEALAELKALASKNKVARNFIGQGYYGTHTPGVILRNVLENPAWYTAYTPYQAEISQGRMEALLNFQTMVCDLTGMAIANASMLDEATAAAEAMTLARRSVKSKSNVFLVSGDCHPQTIEVLKTRAAPLGIEIRLSTVTETLPHLMAQGDFFGALAQYPSSTGHVYDLRPLAGHAHQCQAAFCVAADLLALALLSPPGEWDADIVCGTTQRFGMPLCNGGPHAAYLACRDDYKRSLPGRLVGVSVDAHGDPAYRLALQTREQHIRREKATSNICTAQVLPAVVASMYAVYHGPDGLTRIAKRVALLTAVLAQGLEAMGRPVVNATSFDTLTVKTAEDTAAVIEKARAAGINLRIGRPQFVGISLDETSTRADVEALWDLLAPLGASAPRFDELASLAPTRIPPELRRTSRFLAHPVFNTHKSETAMLRYIRSLSDKDLALDRSMIPLGSCTMKLNATSEMIPITWPEFANIHPFAPADQLVGYAQLDAQLKAWLCEATGYAGISLQPNAGSQGEYAGLLAIKAFHEARGEGHRKICLIPSSAHGTNPASAQMVGMQVVVTACDAKGNVDLDDLKRACEKHSAQLAAVMITYPSTHGVFETEVKALCELVHSHGGRVYVDGANMNALVGVAAPGEFGGDVSHLNLHKTFCIPHGGGGPGVGPVCVVEDLVPYLPGHAAGGIASNGVGAVSAAPLGNAAVLPISWMYCRMMGAKGLQAATETAILSANYISARLKDHYPTLYASANGHVAHECILDLRPLKETSGVTAEDVAKRLIDYGFHAPTLSFPVPGTLMVEPTESEPLAELDRFIEAMIAIRGEIRRIEEGVWPKDDNPLKHAPHTAASLLGADWARPYSRELGAFPLAGLRHGKYWAPVGRVDNVYGDRNLFCSCLPIEAFETDPA